jgi:multidrug efflux pump subunit AcrB
MIKFLLQRPIAVLMAFTACFIVGLVTYFTIPVSLLPDIAIPEITVQVSGQNTSARELENTVVKTIRQQLMQVASLRDIHSETRDGAAIIRLNFDFGTNTDLAFIEVNEKIDAAMNYLPREVERPRVIKASATQRKVTMMVKEDILGDALIIHFLLQSVFIFELVRKGNSRFEIVQRQFSDLIIAQPVVL